ncbi:hypothetical protein Syn7502_02819 [Synechococcus sp. PCC 7502]|uniref:hypothetical protein n=1 Tax=Synechococcus sp. PCC 7502 TaxID=1173263 RepID=UPI00029FF326|nr:hypothetical protein [Synechococcus sp. PCC 7502]AFY74756.1 hypothetical protein Syn7502_02819 [Synechococcus sp. PCC 7502]
MILEVQDYFKPNIGDLVGTEVGCGEIIGGFYNENGSTFISGIVREIKGDSIKIEVTDPSRHVTMLEVGQIYSTLSGWRLS